MTTNNFFVGLAFALFLVIACVASVKSSNDFAQVCAEANGKVVWDGRQQQCIKPTKETHDND